MDAYSRKVGSAGINNFKDSKKVKIILTLTRSVKYVFITAIASNVDDGASWWPRYLGILETTWQNWVMPRGARACVKGT